MGNTVICTYLVKPECVDDFVALLRDHWSTLQRLNLVTDARPLHFRRDGEDGRPEFVEIFEWIDGKAANSAHEHPLVAAIWNRMEKLVEDREGRRKWQFPHYERLHLGRDEE